jgi:CRISPR-associated protein Csb1
MIDALDQATRLVLEARLRPVIGSTFQPTGFANLGAATFTRPGEPPSLLVESVQSLANHFEALGFDAPANEPIALLAGLPWVRVLEAGGELHLTSSREEPHRLAAAYVRDAAIDGQLGATWLAERLGLRTGRPLDWAWIYNAVFELDPLCLLHGVFFSDKRFHGNPKVRRAISAVIEAHDVAPAISGGVKRDDVHFTPPPGRSADDGYGFIPFGRAEYTAREIVLSASIDLTQLRGYGLPESSTRLLVLLAVWEVVALLGQPLRLRTACDLQLTGEPEIRRPDGFTLPARDELETAIAACGVTFSQAGARVAVWPAPKGAS